MANPFVKKALHRPSRVFDIIVASTNNHAQTFPISAAIYLPNKETLHKISGRALPSSSPSFWQQLMTAINHRLRFFLWEIWETLYRLVNNGEERDSLVECKKWSLCSQSAMPNWNKWLTLQRGQKVPMRPLQKYLFGRGAGVTVCYCRSQYDQCKKYSCRG